RTALPLDEVSDPPQVLVRLVLALSHPIFLNRIAHLRKRRLVYRRRTPVPVDAGRARHRDAAVSFALSSAVSSALELTEFVTVSFLAAALTSLHAPASESRSWRCEFAPAAEALTAPIVFPVTAPCGDSLRGPAENLPEFRLFTAHVDARS